MRAMMPLCRARYDALMRAYAFDAVFGARVARR